jgi:hypothetical protein
MIEPENNRLGRLICRGMTSGCCSLCALWIVAVENFGGGGRGLVTTKNGEQGARSKDRQTRQTDQQVILTTTTTTTTTTQLMTF